jgi:hypothetical protein
MIQYIVTRQYPEKKDTSFEPYKSDNPFNDCKFCDPLALQIESEICVAVGEAFDAVYMATDSDGGGSEVAAIYGNGF